LAKLARCSNVVVTDPWPLLALALAVSIFSIVIAIVAVRRARKLDQGFKESLGFMMKLHWERTDPSLRDLAQQAVDASDRRNAELAAMSPEDREKAINEWAQELADDVADLDD
jgi:hypothetical protein